MPPGLVWSLRNEVGYMSLAVSLSLFPVCSWPFVSAALRALSSCLFRRIVTSSSISPDTSLEWMGLLRRAAGDPVNPVRPLWKTFFSNPVTPFSKDPAEDCWTFLAGLCLRSFTKVGHVSFVISEKLFQVTSTFSFLTFRERILGLYR